MITDLTRDDVAALKAVALELRADAVHLAGLIDFESSWDPQRKNPGSSARGLIQFMDATAHRMGYTGGSAQLVAAHPTIESQLRGPVLQYLRPMAPYPSLQSLAMAVFYPAARAWPEDRPFPRDVQLANRGIETVGDYMRRVRRHELIARGFLAASSPAGKGAIAGVLLALGAGAAWWASR